MLGFGRSSSPVSNLESATVTKWLQGFGFASRGEGTKDVFIHKSVLPEGTKKLNPGQKIKVAVENVEKGVAATKIELVS